jgi:hypothetical protein
MKFTEQYYLDSYIDYLNNFLTIGGYADYYHIDYNDAEFIINKGREIYKVNQPYQIEKIKCGNTVLFAVFPTYISKFTVKLSECEIYKNLYDVIEKHTQGIYKNKIVSLLDAKENNKLFIKPFDSECGEWVKIKDLQLV